MIIERSKVTDTMATLVTGTRAVVCYIERKPYEAEEIQADGSKQVVKKTKEIFHPVREFYRARSKYSIHASARQLARAKKRAGRQFPEYNGYLLAGAFDVL